MEEGTVEHADFEERLAVGAEAMGEGVRFGPENILPRRDLRGGDASDCAEREARLDAKDSQGDRPSGFGDGGVEMSLSTVALPCVQGPRSNLR